MKLCPIKSKVNSAFKIPKLFQFQNCLSHGFEWLLFTAVAFEISSGPDLQVVRGALLM